MEIKTAYEMEKKDFPKRFKSFRASIENIVPEIMEKLINCENSQEYMNNYYSISEKIVNLMNKCFYYQSDLVSVAKWFKLEGNFPTEGPYKGYFLFRDILSIYKRFENGTDVLEKIAQDLTMMQVKTMFSEPLNK